MSEVRVTQEAADAMAADSASRGHAFVGARKLPDGYVAFSLSPEVRQKLEELEVDPYDPEALSTWIYDQLHGLSLGG